MTTEQTAPGMAEEIAREMKGLTKKTLVAGIKMHRSAITAGMDRSGMHCEALENLTAEYRRRYGKDI